MNTSRGSPITIGGDKSSRSSMQEGACHIWVNLRVLLALNDESLGSPRIAQSSQEKMTAERLGNLASGMDRFEVVLVARNFPVSATRR